MKKQKKLFILFLTLAMIALTWGVDWGRTPSQATGRSRQNDSLARSFQAKGKRGIVTYDQRKAAAQRYRAARSKALAKLGTKALAAPDPGGVPHYFGPYANYANSPLPKGAVAGITLTNGGTGYVAPTVLIEDLYGTGSGATATAMVVGDVITAITLGLPGSGYSAPIVTIIDATGTGATATATISGSLTGGIKKFVDQLSIPPVAVPDIAAYPGSDYYEIELREYSQKMHTDLLPTKLRGYIQVQNGGDVGSIHYLGPIILAQRDRPVRIKFTNALPTGAGGDLFIPTDTTIMGAGMGPTGDTYTQNRAAVHLHGNNTVWISDGTPHQWITPANESTPYPQGVSVYNVPDMPDPGAGSLTIYYTNQQSARLMFYHDHAYGITRLNVYAGEAAGYVLTDQVEKDLIEGTNLSGVNPGFQKVLPDLGIPFIIQDKTFVDAATIAAQDPTWNWGTGPRDVNGKITAANTGDLWYPHVYMPNQNPWDASGMNAFGRWHYGPWFWPPATNLMYPPIANPYYSTAAPWEPPMMPATPNPSSPAEAFMDTPIVNGIAYPFFEVEPKAYRFRILNAANDRFLNLQFYVADLAVTTADGRTSTEVKMVPAVQTTGYPAGWPTDGREGGVPDPATAGPSFIQIGTEGGFLPAPVLLSNQPVGWNFDQTNFDFGNVNQGTLILGTAERADVIVDFSAFAGKTLILYNDSPAPFPAIDARYDYYTGNPDMTDIGGTPTTQPGYGPNTRTIMQIRVGTSVTTPFTVSLPALEAAFAMGPGTKRGVFEVSQEEIIIPQAAYNSAYNSFFPVDTFVRIHDNSKTFQTLTGALVTLPFQPKAIQDEMGEAFDTDYGRMSAMLGLELPGTAAGAQNFILYPYASPPVEIVKGTVFGTPLGALTDGTQIWKITHNGVDTHTIHTHLFNVQLINRVAWDDALRPPDPNELGWKETIRVNPLQDTIVALRPILPNVPFKVPNSIRLIDPTKPDGAPLSAPLGGFKDPNGVPVAINNHLVNFGWEYVYHCHLLAHEEMDMMHSVVFAVPPGAPSALTVSVKGGKATLTWTDNSLNETGFTIQRAADAGFTTGLTTFTVGPNVTTYTDATIKNNQTYYYRVFASNLVGSPQPGFPNATVVSTFSNTAVAGQGQPPADPSNLSATTITRTSVTLTWTDNSNNEDGFLIQRADNNGFSQGLTSFTVGPNVTTFTDTTVQPNTRYYYRVRSFNGLGNSGFSNTINVTTLR
jgi:FtsP/CotA-like multicopper oxidase with cupredoxin domain